MRGGARNIKSVKEKKSIGTYRKDRHAGVLEESTRAVSSVPQAPEDFDARHLDRWKKVCSALIDAGVLTDLDLSSVRMFVENEIIANDAWADVNKNGAVLYVESAGGVRPIRNPAHMVYNDATKIIRQLSDQFGLNPRSRMGLKVSTPKDEIDHLADIWASGNQRDKRAKA